MDKGTRVKIVRGRDGKGVSGSVFWIGENKFGEGKRLGVRGDDGQTYWVNSEDVDDEEAAPPPPPPSGPVPERGDRVRWTQGGASGLGEVFWTGKSKHGPGMRFGVKCDDEETRWLDQRFVEPSDEPAPPAAAPQAHPSGNRGSAPPPSGAGWHDDEEDDGYIGGGGWDGSPPPEMGDQPPPPEPPADFEDEDVPF